MPRLSLVIPTYNRRPKLADCLASVDAQTRRPDELIVVEDCSPDDTKAWAAAHRPDVRLLSTPVNSGVSAARNLGARAATGELVMFFDDDDVLLPHAVETLLGLRAAFPEARAVFADHRYENRAAGLVFENHHTAQAGFRRLAAVPAVRTAPEGRLYARPLYRAMLRGNLLQQPWAVDRDVFLAVGGYAPDVKIAEDWELYLRLVRAVPVALTDAVISTHILDARDNRSLLDMATRQSPSDMQILGRRLRQDLLTDPRSAVLAARRLAMYHKTAGDAAYPSSVLQAWKHYVRSFALWPFDSMVAVGTLTGFAPWWLTGRKRAAPDMNVPLPKAAE